MQPDIIRPCRSDEHPRVLAIVNDAARRYRGVIPDDRWRDPYMTRGQLAAEIAAGVDFWGLERDGELIGVMGAQPVKDVELIRHAYVATEAQGGGVGGALLRRLLARSARPILLGAWADATWAIGFYQKHGFELVPPQEAADLLRTYWSIPERQIATSVVLRLHGSGALPVV